MRAIRLLDRGKDASKGEKLQMKSVLCKHSFFSDSFLTLHL